MIRSEVMLVRTMLRRPLVDHTEMADFGLVVESLSSGIREEAGAVADEDVVTSRQGLIMMKAPTNIKNR
ncbi:unnamed protein product, partial [Iphiclides podalirius]